jgi:hypothetical protein
MSLESDVGRITHDVMGALSDALASNLTVVLKKEMNLTDEQITRVTSIAKLTIENVGYNGVNQYVSLFNRIQSESSETKKSKLFG